ncbi:hypothetical protein HHK36_005915 [Tetracentron sinense]|uniref:Deoxyhypusine synthase n=1 Tax=Tetracentron sinense TaxID=13715 RepID=A0A834ZG90_TETSI|nr:hypothetical protein HHK36_005915 [Tetracentron sinense]
MGEAVERQQLLASLRSTVFKESETLGESFVKIEGYDFNRGLDYSQLLKSMVSTGFQASNLGDAIQVVNQMLDWRLADEVPTEDCSEEESNPSYRESVRCKIFLGFTSNLISSGVRETVRFLVEHHMVDVVVTTTGGIEEDLIKCLAPTYKGDFSLPGAHLRSKGLNRIGNLLVPNDNYCKFEDWIIPIFDQMLEEQSVKKVLWTPSKVIARLGKEINDPSSYLIGHLRSAMSENNIPVFCPGLTDGSIGGHVILPFLPQTWFDYRHVQDYAFSSTRHKSMMGAILELALRGFSELVETYDTWPRKAQAFHPSEYFIVHCDATMLSLTGCRNIATRQRNLSSLRTNANWAETSFILQ